VTTSPTARAEVFAACINRDSARRLPETSIEVLIPDFKGNPAALRIVVDAKPDILNHNLETIERLYRIARPGGRYPRALELLRRAKELDAGLLTKSGIICGLARIGTSCSVRCATCGAQGVDILTLGQYLRSLGRSILPIARWYNARRVRGAEAVRTGVGVPARRIGSAGPLELSRLEQVEAAKA